MIELLVTILIVAALIASAGIFVSSYAQWSRQTADRQTLTVLNDALTRYKGQGGSVAALTSQTPISHVISRLQQLQNWGGVSHSFLQAGYTYLGRSVAAKGEGAQYRFTRYNTYTAEEGGTSPTGHDYNPTNDASRYITGYVSQEYWTGANCGSLATLGAYANYPNSPSGRTSLPTLGYYTSTSLGLSTRARGYFIPSSTGNYTFSIYGADYGQTIFYISTDSNPGNKAATGPVTNGSATSGSLSMTAGSLYYIEIISAFGGGRGTNWYASYTYNSTTTSPIGGNCIAPYPIGGSLAIVTQPHGSTVSTGSSYTFDVLAFSSQTPLTYQWYKDSTPIAGATHATLTLTELQSSDSGNFYCIIGDGTTSVTSNSAGLTVVDSPIAGYMSMEYWSSANCGTLSALNGYASYPSSPSGSQYLASLGYYTTSTGRATRARGYFVPPATGNYTFSIYGSDYGQSVLYVGTGADPSSKVQVGPATNATKTSGSFSMTAGQPYYIEVVSAMSSGRATNWYVTYTYNSTTYSPISGSCLLPYPVASTLTIARQPEGGTLPTGATYTFATFADSTAGRVNYQWYKDGSPISGATEPTLTLSNMGTSNSGSYACYVYDGVNSLTTNSATLTVTSSLTTGSITLQYWTGIASGLVGELTGLSTYPSTPTATLAPTSMTYTNGTGGLGVLAQGYFIPPSTGSYEFTLYGADYGRTILYLSPNANANAKQYLGAATNGTITTSAQTLTAGAPCYIEVLSVNSTGRQTNWTVGYKLNAGATVSPIPGSALAPFR